MATSAIPNIDPSVKYVGVSKLRDLNATKLKEQTEETLVIQDNEHTPLAVLLSYKKFLAIREEFQAVLNMIELLTNAAERTGLVAAFEDLRAGRIRSLAEIEAELESE